MLVKEAVSTINPQTAPEAIQTWLKASCLSVDQALEQALALPDFPDDDPVSQLGNAMRYAVLSGGKRLRPALVLATAKACGGTSELAMPAAVAVELLHAYTLVHDDLPAMDDDDERRGKPTVHVQYDEATAILTGDALLTLAFETLAKLQTGTGDAVACLAKQSGRDHLLGGQMLDLRWQNNTPSFAEVERLHRGKTGALFAASCQLGAIAAGASQATCTAMHHYGLALGVAFQHADDLDDRDFPEHANEAKLRRKELAITAEKQLHSIGCKDSLLRDLVQWIGQATG